MSKTFTKGLFLLLLPLLVIVAAASAQTITVGAVDPGPYGQGSSIAVPIKVDNMSGCIGKNNVYRLYLSNASGSFASQVQIGQFDGFYATFVNGTIPATTSAGTGYRVRVVSSSPSVTSTASAPFTIKAVTGVLAGITTPQLLDNNKPDLFGVCIADENNPPPAYDFTNTSTAGATVSANFFNELTQAVEATNKPMPFSFDANLANYTITVKAEKGGLIGTKSYMLVNNVVNNSFSVSGSTTICLNGSNPLTYNVIISGNQGIQRNFPGLTYNINWGDGTIDNFTICDIVKAGGKVVHNYTTSSCGMTTNGQHNVFKVDLQPVSAYCSNLVAPLTSYAKVLQPAKNEFTFPPTACTNTPVTFTNTSDPGMDPNNTGPECKNLNARYSWYVNGVLKTPTPLRVDQPFVYTFPAHGTYTVSLRLLSNNVLCPADDKLHSICIQDPPQPRFTIPSVRCLSDGPLTPVDNSVIDAVCSNTANYNWKLVSGPADGVTFNAAAKLPQFNFSKIGIYRFQLDITAASCGVVSSPIKEIVVNTTPSATLSPAAIQCGKSVTLSFDPTAISTKTTFDGTAQASATTYKWVVTSPDGGTSSFATGSTANSQYPRITFNEYATYNISVTHTNNCGTVTKTQQLKFVQSPTVSAGQPQPNVCEGSLVSLTGSPGVGGLVTGVKWTSPTGGTFTTPNAPNTTYTPTPADITNGQVLLTYTATTSLAAPCNQIPSTVLITIIKKATVTSNPTPSPICSGNAFNYTITAANPATTFTWSAVVTSGTATGYIVNGNTNTITAAAITNSGNTDAVITYNITPALNGCAGTPFALKLTVHPLPGITANPVNLEICSDQPANITLTSNINPTTYTWTSVASTGITGNTTRAVAATATSIQDVLVNNSNAAGTVTYKITPYNGTCPGPVKTVTRTVKPAPKQSVAGPDEAICISTTYTLKGNDPSPGTGKWTVTSGQAGVTVSNDTDPHAVVSGLQPGQIYKFTWTITAAAGCPPTQSTVTITNNAEAIGGTTAGTATVCAPTNNGSVTLSGYTGTILRWESSVNNGTTWSPVANTTATLNYSNLTQTTQYRAVINGGSCGNEFSTVTTITVNQPAVTANAGADNPQCNVTSVNLQGNNPASFVGKWTKIAGPAITIVNPADPQTQVTGLAPGNSYTFRWTIKGVTPCSDSFDDVVITNGSNVTANFTSQTQVCGAIQVNFTNTSTPVLPGTVYEWNFGDGSPVSNAINPTHIFQPAADGKDLIYHVKLTVVGNCVPSQHTQDITVSPVTPVALIAPPDNSQDCGTLNLTLHNLSPGNNASYTFYLVDENYQEIAHVGPLTDKSDAVFPPQTPLKSALWHVYIIAKNNCGIENQPAYRDIPVTPSTAIPGIQLKDGINAVCLGTPIVFQNISTGGDSFTYNIYDADQDKTTQVTGGLADLPYIFPHAGDYQVSITARNNACTSAPTSPVRNIQIYPLPQPQFTFTTDVDNKVTFVNTSPDAGTTPATSLTYEWDFGDGSPKQIGFTPADHVYDYTKSPYTVTLTATNPATTCQGIKTHTIEIKFTGELFLPNAFQPASSKAELRTFKAKGQKLKEWRMQIFNNWGQLVWQTTQLDSNGEPVEGWDGTFKGQPAQQGVYIWQITAKFLNGSDWRGMSYNGSLPKRSGTINLIR